MGKMAIEKDIGSNFTKDNPSFSVFTHTGKRGNRIFQHRKADSPRER
jgi:hypothetical protein